MSFLINASNLHSGGAVQVATSFIYEVSLLKSSKTINVLVSSLVDENLRALNTEINSFNSYKVADFRGFKDIFSKTANFISSFDVVFTVFGPSYLFFKPSFEIVGFAQPWIIFPNNLVYSSLNFKNKIFTKIKFSIQKYFFSRADHLVVELEHVKECLLNINSFKNKKITVVHNCVSSLYFEPNVWKPVILPVNNKSNINIGYISRDYPHKNLDFLPYVKDILLEKYSINAKLFVTLTDYEWSNKSKKFKDSVINIGPLNVNQCPSFYNYMDLILFPSLLECFSATPLEAMIMKKALFSSDRKFVRDVCFDYAEYFDPTDPESAASSIASNYPFSQERLNIAMKHATKFSSAKDRAMSYINLMKVSK